ncbi:MAG TPA: membrane protein insertase YidC, partial [Steroidobacteraceae bacterium]|nr:membrane protein insertase YidC [Steroidobacteraceae bacterium]
MSTINNPRLFLWAALALLLFADYQAWMTDYGPKPGAPGVASGAQHPGTSPAPSSELANRVPEAPPAAAPATGAAPPGTATVPAASAATAAVSAQAQPAPDAAPVVHVRTDVLDALISTRGGTVQQVDLLAYPKVKGGSEPVRLENDAPQSLYLLQSGLTGPAGAAYPTHVADFTSAQDSYTLDGGA